MSGLSSTSRSCAMLGTTTMASGGTRKGELRAPAVGRRDTTQRRSCGRGPAPAIVQRKKENKGVNEGVWSIVSHLGVELDQVVLRTTTTVL